MNKDLFEPGSSAALTSRGRNSASYPLPDISPAPDWCGSRKRGHRLPESADFWVNRTVIIALPAYGRFLLLLGPSLRSARSDARAPSARQDHLPPFFSSTRHIVLYAHMPWFAAPVQRYHRACSRLNCDPPSPATGDHPVQRAVCYVFELAALAVFETGGHPVQLVGGRLILSST